MCGIYIIYVERSEKMLNIKGYFKYIIFGIISFLLLILLRNIYAIKFDIEELLKIILLDFGDFEKLGLEKFTLPYIAAFLIILCFICNYVSFQFVKINNTYYIARFSFKQHYIMYVLKNIMAEIFIFLLIWFVIIIGYLYSVFHTVSIHLFISCLLNIFKMGILIYIIHIIYILIILMEKKKNLGISLLLLFLIFCVDILLETHFLTMSSRLNITLIYLFIELVVLLLLSYTIINYYTKKKEIGEYYD